MTRPAVTLGYLRPSSKDEMGNRRGGRDPRDQYGGQAERFVASPLAAVNAGPLYTLRLVKRS